jgi:hypothetical protein
MKQALPIPGRKEKTHDRHPERFVHLIPAFDKKSNRIQNTTQESNYFCPNKLTIWILSGTGCEEKASVLFGE